MIHLGMTAAEKAAAIQGYCSEHGITEVVMLSPARFAFDCGVPGTETVEWAEVIMYRTFYPLLQRIGAGTLVVVNECLRTQDRYDLTYNCIRHFLNQAGHQLVFQWLPCIEGMQDFMVLFDFDTRSRWKREPFDPSLVMENAKVSVTRRTPRLTRTDVPTCAKAKAAYAAAKERLFRELGSRDPHTIPRNLHLLSGKSKLDAVGQGEPLVGRNNRFKLAGMSTYDTAVAGGGRRRAFEMPHRFIDFSDFLAASGQEAVDVLTTDLPVDGWYFDRFTAWAGRVSDGYAELQ